MVEIGIVPTPHGYAAVGLRDTLGKDITAIRIRTPLSIAGDVQDRIVGNLLLEVADYLYTVSRYRGIGLLAFLWAAAGVAALLLNKLGGYGFKFIALYGWVRVWFLCDGLWLFLPYIAKLKHRLLYRRIKRFLESPKVEVKLENNWPKLTDVPPGDEEASLQALAEEWENAAAFYQQMLKRDPPGFSDHFPATVWERLLNLLRGAPIRLPRMVYYVLGEQEA